MKWSTQALGALGWFTITFAAAALGAWASTSAASFYATLALPAWAPPASLFGPVWTLLYAMMAVAAWLVWRERGTAATRPALTLYLLQLGVNALWSWLFFGWRLGALALVDILLLVMLVVATLIAFARIRALAAVMLLPYLGWITFASTLNLAVWRANPGVL
ncbi:MULTISPECIES: TspO/MBR family protein [Stenotrophomonas]|jgi:tryptophan-rich sensory protein|uniref:TspO/MBR family protein n=1 Tax=Stenotrophomonas TaxID=40323 RepID=UPI00201CEF2B|nr:MULTISPECIES: TspO/MBR family protein [Stenotrophomonas]MBN5023678.1 tryptophan-rich sensory protein [Stenotrophomonas maltophilia]MDH1272328.1 tryptophan-rich sensory protein [Stenotrophomonas sp. GD03937]MDH1483362.1 tryptophan-rich sensory protein [Stenotrophomonas sp. GD03712]UQY96619.1 tryptophan-rich sensory protein [Stenotrophomonas maltophilia]WON66746.1 TspO/MBR family protein [Stenotrophomonas maltophilia]